MPASTVLTAIDLAKSFGPDEIFRDVSFQVADREHVAIVGVNGAGKSTLLRIVAGLEHPTQGEIALARGARVAVLAQEPRFDSDRTVRQEAHLAFGEALTAMARMRELEHGMQSASGEALDDLFQEYERLSVHFEISGGFAVEHRTEEVLSGLGFDGDQIEEPVRTLSGGQKTRVALAKTLLTDPDLLLLDEPTNHLDLEMLEWLEGFLKTWRGSFLVVSHDRYFLDKVTDRTLELSFGQVEDYPAGYARFLVLREERLARRRQEYDEQQEHITRTEDYIRRYKAGQRSREARGRQTRLDRLERIARPQEHAALKLQSAASSRSGRDVVTTTPLQVGYTESGMESILVSTPELHVERGDRIAMIGKNGSGKSTLLRSIVGELPLLTGRVGFGANVTMGYYAQGHEGLPTDGTPLSIMLATQPMDDESARSYLARFLFRGDEVARPIAALSGGERSRLALACLLIQGANLLVLDEPTNHLDIQARETLEQMLAAYSGTVLLVSHDRYFIDRVSTKVWEIEDGRLAQHLGNYSDAMRQKSRLQSVALRDASVPAKNVTATANVNANPTPSRTGVENESRLQKRMFSVERDIGRCEGRLNELSDSIAIAGVDSDHEALTQLAVEYAETETQLEGAYAQWEELNTQLDSLTLATSTG
ncbi:MAG: ABC-F family ATP-binding cassette domain-containing protein [Chloroflexia bacterium]|nr:ABC-F family ATP-binding cassette domain-containing protein [Chloroflexia bacterium]